MAFIPGSADLSMVLTMMRKLATSASMDAQLVAAQASLQPGTLTFTLRDRAAPGGFETVEISEEDFPDAGWFDTHIKGAGVAETLQVTPPFPNIQILAMPGSRPYEEADWQGYLYRIAVVAFAGGDHERLVQRAAIVIGECYARLMRRDQSLGGLVKMLRQVSTVEAGGGGPHKDSPVVMASRVVFEALVITP